MNRLLRNFVAFVSICLLATQALSQTLPRPVALSGATTPAGGSYTAFGTNPALNAACQVTFTATTSAASSGLFAGTPGSPFTTIALAGTAAPSGGNFSSFGNPKINASGKVSFFAAVSGSGVGIFAGTSGTLATAALLNGPTPAGGNYSGFGSSAMINNAGQVAFLAGTTTAGTGIFAGTPGSPLIVAARTGTAAPSGGNFTGISDPVLNPIGQIAFTATTTGGIRGIYAGTPGSTLTTAALQGTASPDGSTYASFVSTTINRAGQVAFIAGTTGVGNGIFAGTPGTPMTTVAYASTPAPMGGNYAGTFSGVALNATGKVAFVADTGSGLNGIFAGTPGSPMSKVAFQNTAAPNCGGATFSAFTGTTIPTINSSGAVAFLATLNSDTGSPSVTAANNQGLFAGLPGNLVLVVRKGAVIDVDPTATVDNRTVSSINFLSGSGGEEGKGMSLSDSGLLVYSLTFTDNSSGIFTSTVPVPEPSLFLGTAAAGLMALRRIFKGRFSI